MQVLTEILGNIHSPEWAERLAKTKTESIFLDQWTAQKSRFLASSDAGTEYPVALKRHSQIADGDIVYYNPEEGRAVVLRLALSPVLVVDLSGIASLDHDTIIRVSVELGHAIGNQHWPAVVRGTKVYVPLTVDRKVMGITYDFQEGQEVIPYLAPHEIRRLFGGAGQESHSHEHGHDHSHPHHHDHCH